MIFVTVGTQLPFDRMIRAIDWWAGQHREEKVFAQIGPSQYRPCNLEFASFLDADECLARVESAKVIVAHAGMGSIITALEFGKPIIVMPRRADRNEHRNDHQLATARGLLVQGKVVVAFDEAHLVEKLDNLEMLVRGNVNGRGRPDEASPQLIATLRKFIDSGTYKASSLATMPARLERAPSDLREEVKVEKIGLPLSKESLQVLPETIPQRKARALLESELPGKGVDGGSVTLLSRASNRHGGVRRFAREQEDELSGWSRNMPSQAMERLAKLNAVILLEGSLRPTPFAAAINRSLVEMPVTNRQSILDVWREQVAEFAKSLGRDRISCRIVAIESTKLPSLSPADRDAGLTVECDPKSFRGTGGVLHDLAGEFDDDGLLLVASAGLVLLEKLPTIAKLAGLAAGDVVLMSNPDGSPANITLIKCRALRELPSLGFIDFKEQGLPLIGKKHQIDVQRCEHAVGMSIRTLKDYLNALRAYDRLNRGHIAEGRPFAERWNSHFTVVENGAHVDSAAYLHDTVVLAGGAVESGALTARSVICDGGRVSRDRQAIDAIVANAV
jgi:UDP-N-acetylglucosamine transferase subunit ALG13